MSRQKTDLKKNQILQVAAELFLKHGLEGVSMSQIARAVGGSKATLYNYFQNKEELFVEVIDNSAKQIANSILAVLEQDLPLYDKLRIWGIKYIELLLSEKNIAFVCNVFNCLPYIKQNQLGNNIYDKFMHSTWDIIADLLSADIQSGRLRPVDLWFATMQLKSLFELDLIQRNLLKPNTKISHDEIVKNVDAGLAIFMNYYQITQ